MTSLQQITDARYAPVRPLVLVADDDPDTRFLFRTVLEIRGYCVIEAADGEETVRAAESARPDLILMGGSLPRLSGLEAARQIRRVRPHRPRTHCLYLGARGSGLHRTGPRSQMRRVLREAV